MHGIPAGKAGDHFFAGVPVYQLLLAEMVGDCEQTVGRDCRLAFAGERAVAEIEVLNPKNIRTVVLDGRLTVLPDQLRQRINHLLDQKCRDVEF